MPRKCRNHMNVIEKSGLTVGEVRGRERKPSFSGVFACSTPTVRDDRFGGIRIRNRQLQTGSAAVLGSCFTTSPESTDPGPS